MSIRLPLRKVLNVQNTAVNATGPASTAGGVAHNFRLPQDTDNVVVKFTASVLGGGASATLQTTDDGGSTWYDVARTSVISNAVSENAQWISAPVIGAGVATAISGSPAAGSILSVGIGSAAASTLASRQNSGMPILSQQGRIFLRYTAAITSILSETVEVMANSQSGRS